MPPQLSVIVPTTLAALAYLVAVTWIDRTLRGRNRVHFRYLALIVSAALFLGGVDRIVPDHERALGVKKVGIAPWTRRARSSPAPWRFLVTKAAGASRILHDDAPVATGEALVAARDALGASSEALVEMRGTGSSGSERPDRPARPGRHATSPRGSPSKPGTPSFAPSWTTRKSARPRARAPGAAQADWARSRS